MRLDVIFSANHIRPEMLIGKNAVVIDVLRASSVIVTALKNGATSVKTFKEPEDVFKYAEENPHKNIVLGGERKGFKIEGFDFGNSPLEYNMDTIKGKELVMTTTNGTKTIEKSISADNLYIMSFLNINTVLRRLLKEQKDVVFICAGTDEAFSTDDTICAALCMEYMISLQSNVEVSDASRFIKDFYHMSDKNLNNILKGTKHYEYLKKIDHEEDINYCLTVNIYDTLPYYDKKDKVIYKAE